jgi:hypothetical protein
MAGFRKDLTVQADPPRRGVSIMKGNITSTGQTIMRTDLALSPQEWCRRIEAFQIDEGTPDLSFRDRLARENRWTKSYADRVIREYLRFVTLAMTAGHTVTPSDQVDQAWHLHLTYTHSYWDRLCGEVLGRPLHHGPTRGGRSESDKYWECYQRTLASYQSLFGQPPPRDIWPPPEVRFGADLNHVRVNTTYHRITPKRWFPFDDSRRIAAAAGLLALAYVFAKPLHHKLSSASGNRSQETPLSSSVQASALGDSDSQFFWLLLIPLVVIVVLKTLWFLALVFFGQRQRPLHRNGVSGDGASGCSTPGMPFIFFGDRGDTSDGGSGHSGDSGSADCGGGSGDCGGGDGGGGGCGGGGCSGGGCGG